MLVRNIGRLALCLCLFPHAAFAAGYQKAVVSQKGQLQKGKSSPVCTPCRHPDDFDFCCPPPPIAPVLEAAAILRVDPPRPSIDFRLRQESGFRTEGDRVAESGRRDEQTIEQRVENLERRFDTLTELVGMLVDKLKQQ